APEPTALEPPEVDDIADQIEGAAIIVGQEVRQQLGFAAGRAEMDIGDENRAVAARQVGRQLVLNSSHRTLPRLRLHESGFQCPFWTTESDFGVLCRDSMTPLWQFGDGSMRSAVF